MAGSGSGAGVSTPRLSMLPLPTPGIYSYDASVNTGLFNGSYINLSASLQDLQTELARYSLDNTHVASSLWVCASAVWGLAGLYIVVVVCKQARRQHVLTWPHRRQSSSWSAFRERLRRWGSRKTGPISLPEKIDHGMFPTSRASSSEICGHEVHSNRPRNSIRHAHIVGSPLQGAMYGRRATQIAALESGVRAESGERPSDYEARMQTLPDDHGLSQSSSSHLHQSVRFSDAALVKNSFVAPNENLFGLTTPVDSATLTSPPISPLVKPDAFVANRPHTDASSRAISPPDDTGPASRHKRQRRLEWSHKFPLYLGLCGIWMFPWSLSMHLYQAITGFPMSGTACRLVGIGYFHSTILPLVITMAVGILVSFEAHYFRDIRLGWMDWRLSVSSFVTAVVLALLPLAQGGYDDSPHVCLAGGMGSRDYWLPLLNFAVWIVTAVVSVTSYTYTLQEQKVYDSDREVTRRVMIYGTSCIAASAFQLPARIFLIINPNPETIAAAQEDLALQTLSAMYPLIIGAVLAISFVFWNEQAAGTEYRHRLSMTRALRQSNLTEKQSDPQNDYEESESYTDGFGLDWHGDFRPQSWSLSEGMERASSGSDRAHSRRSSTWSYHYPGDDLVQRRSASPVSRLVSLSTSPSKSRPASTRSFSSGSIQIIYQPRETMR